jgi:hypothetical protein
LPPRVVRPPATFVEKLSGRYGQQPAQFRQLRFAVVDEVDARISAKLLQHRLVVGVLGVENSGRECCDGRLLRRPAGNARKSLTVSCGRHFRVVRLGI